MALDAQEIENFITSSTSRLTAARCVVPPYVEDDFHSLDADVPVRRASRLEEFYRNLTGKFFDREHEVRHQHRSRRRHRQGHLRHPSRRTCGIPALLGHSRREPSGVRVGHAAL